MRAYPIATFLAGLVCLLSAGCGANKGSETAKAEIPWSRVKQVEVTTDSNGEQQPAASGDAIVAPGASQSQVILAWGVPEYILDSPADPEHEVWQYPNAVVVFQGTKVQQVLAR